MYLISAQLYDEAANAVREASDGENYLSGSLRFDFGGIHCTLRLSAILYYKRLDLPEGSRRVLHDAVPVWWEFHTEDDSGEQLNDFSFEILRSCLQQGW